MTALLAGRIHFATLHHDYLCISSIYSSSSHLRVVPTRLAFDGEEVPVHLLRIIYDIFSGLLRSHVGNSTALPFLSLSICFPPLDALVAIPPILLSFPGSGPVHCCNGRHQDKIWFESTTLSSRGYLETLRPRCQRSESAAQRA